jgi:hypothetical protein
VFNSRSDDAISSELSARGVRVDAHRIEELERALGTSGLQRQVEQILPGDPSEALRALDHAFMAGFELVMAISAGVFGLALLVAVIGLRGQPGRRAAWRDMVTRPSRDGPQPVPGRLEG